MNRYAVVDIETDDPLLKKLGQSYIFGAGSVIGVGILEPDTGKEGFYSADDPYVRDILKDPNITKIFHNGIYDLSWLNVGCGLEVNGRIEDTMTRATLLDSYVGAYSLDACCYRMGVAGKNKGETIEDWWKTWGGGKGKAVEHLKEIPIAVVGRYCIGDLDATWALFQAQQQPLADQDLLHANDIECRLYPFLLAMKRNGFRINVGERARLAERLETEYSEGIRGLWNKYGIEPRLAAASYLEKIWKIEHLPIEYTSTGKPSFAAAVLDDCSHPVAKQIKHLKGLQKTLSTFVDGALVDYQINGHIYPDFFPALRDEGGTVTGRYSSRAPNCQNFSAREDKYGPEIRSLFIPEDNCILGAYDYKQIEYRVFLHFASGPGAATAKQKFVDDPNTDYHQMTIDLMNWGSMGKAGRHLAKNFNFGSIYGLGPKSFAERFKQNLIASHPDADPDNLLPLAKGLMNEYYRKVPFAKATCNLIQDTAARRGYVRTLSGRRQRMPADQSKVYKLVNYLIQGSASDILKKGQVDAWEAGVFSTLKIHATIHDENVFSAPKTKEGVEACKAFAEYMAKAYELTIPIGVDTEMGPDWGHCNNDNTKEYFNNYG